jgi:hypothetical protein
MSRIWEMIKQARLQRSRDEANQRSAGREDRRTPSERRSASRRAHRAELLVYGSGEDRQPFHEGAETIDANDSGCLLVIETSVSPGQRLFLTNAQNLAEQECRVVHVGQRAQGKLRVGVQFPNPVSHFWNLPEAP